MRPSFAPALLAFALLSAAPAGTRAEPFPADTEPAIVSPLPAWELPGEKAIPGKADEWDDYRAAHPEWFGITTPPVVPVRPFAEYEPTRAVLLRPSKSISKFHKEILKGIHGHVPRIVLLHVPEQKDALEDQLDDWKMLDETIELVDVGEINANWTRDYGPLSIVAPDGRIGLVDFRYYHGRAYDDAIPGKLADHWGIHAFRPSLSYEGGNFMADPHGTCYATQKIFNQNGGYSTEQVREWMRQYMGCTQLVTCKLPEKLGTGHIDMFSKLMDDETVLLGYYDPAIQPVNAAILDDNEEILEAVVTEAGKSLAIHRIPLPRDDSNVWYTYTNSLIVNDVVLVPVYSDFEELEAEALAVYEAAAPDLAAVTINADAIIPAGGAIHCVTMTVPEGILEPFQDPPVQLCAANEYKKCGGLGDLCEGLPYEGRCVDGKLEYCGPDHYPHAQECLACCGFDPDGLGGLGWYDCLPETACAACLDECAPGEGGCSALGTHEWVCVEGDGGCRERLYEPCGGGEECLEETGLCEPVECPPEGCPEPCGDCPFPGARRCSDEGLVLVCEAAGDGCFDYVAQPPCGEGLVCFDGVCAEPLPEPDTEDVLAAETDPPSPHVKGGGGCAAAPAGAHPGALNAAWLLLAALGLLWERRRVR